MFLRLTIALISATALGYEILLTRLLSIIQWHHFAYMMISLALLGFGISGTFLTLAQRWLLPRWAVVLEINAALLGLTVLGSFCLAQQIPFNALEIAWDSRQLLYLGGYYLMLAVPFFCAATAIGLALARFKQEVHRIYLFDLLGAGIGALGIVAALFFLSPTNCLRLLAGLAFLAAALARLAGSKRPTLIALWLVLALVVPFTWPSSWTQLNLSEYKGLRLALRVPDTEVIGESSSPLGLIHVVKSPTIPFRHAPGLSLMSSQEPPPQLGIFTDGDSLSVMTHYDGQRESVRYLDFLSSALPYHLLKERPSSPKVLILGAGGGTDVLLAQYHQARHIDAVELNPQVLKLVKETYRDFSGDLYGQENVQTHLAEARGFVARGRRRGKAYDLIQVSLLDSFGAASAGLYALNESYLYTTTALQDYLSLLEPNGFLAITRWLKIPPRDSLKLFATAIDALHQNGVADPSKSLAMIRSWKTSTLLVKRGDLSREDIRSLQTFCQERAFDLVYYPGITFAAANRYNQLQFPYLYEGAVKLLSQDRDEFLRDYKFDIAPASDDSPYFFHFLKWRTIPEILALRGQGGLPLLEWGYPILIASLIQAFVASLVFILLPLWWLRRQALHRRRWGSVFVYFFCLGLAFLFIEMAFIQRFILFLSHPLYAIAVVLAGFLAFAGLGSGASDRFALRLGMTPQRGQLNGIAIAVLGITVVSVLYLFLLPPLFHSLLAWPDPARVAISLALIAPLAFFMGMPFPLGLALLGERQAELIPWAWGINGCASVLSAILATLLAIHFGFTVVIVAAMGLYVLAAGVIKRGMS